MNYKKFLATLFMGASMILANTDNALASTGNEEALTENVTASETAAPITVAEYLQQPSEIQSEILIDLLKQYVEFLKSPMENGQKKPTDVYRNDVTKAQFIVDLFFPKQNDKRSIDLNLFNKFDILLLAVQENEPHAPLVNVLGYFIDQKYSEYKASLNGGAPKPNAP